MIYASLAGRDGTAADRDKALKYYNRFLEVADPDDEMVPKVRALLEQARESAP
jgi:hypothetical protein